MAGATGANTSRIADQILRMQRSTAVAVEAVQSLATKMGYVDTTANLIAKAVESQGMAATEIANNVHLAAIEAQKVLVNMSRVTEATSTTLNSVVLVERVSADVASRTSELHAVIDGFLGEVSVA